MRTAIAQMKRFRGGRKGIASFVLSALAGLGLALYSPDAPSTGAELPVGLVGAVSAWFLARSALEAKPSSRQLRYAGLTGAALAATFVAGAELQVYGAFRLETSALFLSGLRFLGLALYAGLWLLFLIRHGNAWLERLQNSRLEKRLDPDWLTSRRTSSFFALCWAVILLCWLPVWLAYFPGLANYDILTHMQQCVANSYSTLHPVFYTLLLKGCLVLAGFLGGGATLSIAFLCGFQLLLVSASMAYAISAMRKMGATMIGCLVALGFFALFPVFPLMAISTTKDIPFAAFCLMLMVQLFSLFSDLQSFWGSWGRIAAFLATGILLGLWRYNGVFSVLLLLLFIVVFLRVRDPIEKRRHLKCRVTALLGLVFGLTLLANAGLNAATGAKPSFVTRRDMASLPAQQMIRAALEMDRKSDEFRNVLHWYSGTRMLTGYRPWLADYTKRAINVDHDNGWRGFAETWLQTGLKHPKAYLEAFLELNRGLWFVLDRSHTDISGDIVLGVPIERIKRGVRSHTDISGGIDPFGYLQNNQVRCGELGDPIQFDSKIPWLKDFLNRLTTGENAYQYIPVLNLLFSIGFQCWLCLLLFLAAVYRRDRAMSCAMGWMLCLIVVLVAAPAVFVRYTLPVLMGNGVGLMALGRKRPGQGAPGPLPKESN